MIPEEIINLIDNNQIGLYLTCRSLYVYRHLFYKKQVFDYHLFTNTKTVASFLIVDDLQPIQVVKQHIRQLCHVSDLNTITSFIHLTHISFHDDFNQPLTDLPAALTHLTLGRDFNQPLTDLPAALTHLTLGHCFNQPLTDLPAALTHLTLGYCFNQPLTDFPAALTHLTLGYCFNQPLTDLPAALTHLTLGHCFNQPLTDLPAALTHLRLGYYFNQPLHHLPLSLIHLTINDNYKLKTNINTLPQSLQIIQKGKEIITMSKYRK